MSKEIPKAYDPKQVEPRWYATWLEQGSFRGIPDAAQASYCIMIPPPNVTGMLTMGHVLNNTIQDILIRRARLHGKQAMWLPGTDHAGIATQTRVERELRKEGLHRRDLGREKFLEKVWEWREKHGGIILKQLQHLGCSCDWDRTVFTLDEGYAKAVLTAFVELYKRGYIYRGKRMVNWCPASRTALSDEEVIMKPQKGLLYKMRYELVDEPGRFLEISTTRPETLMGDTGVAVHPEDPRYKDLIGKFVWRPFPREQIPIVGDEAVDKEFGTGVLKVTPAHDRVDWEIGQRHNLPTRDVLNDDGTINELGGEEFAGMDRFEARKKAAKKLEELGQLVKAEPYENNVGFSERADVPIEPRLTEQWWMRYPKVEEAKKAVREGFIRFWPDRWEKTYLHWLENIQDWCISRQLWWGHRIPVWYRKGADRKDPANWHVSVDGPADPENWEQDDDVLDTWASSWLWPFATLGWPDMTDEEKQTLDYFYPTTDLVTGPDIIFFWVARMIMAGLEFMGDGAEYDDLEGKGLSPFGQGIAGLPPEIDSRELSDDEIKQRIPFHNVYFTGIIRDDQGRKMSKSLGNSPDPFDLIDKFGADGLRFGVMNIAPKGQDILFSEERVQVGRNFCNKLWNACRFRQMSGELADNSSLAAILGRISPDKLDEYDHWILHRTLETLAAVDKGFDSYEFNQLTQLLYSLFWGDFCDWYVEVSKTKLESDVTRANVLAIQDFVIREVLLMLNPFTPHITEELWQLLGYAKTGQQIQETRMETADILSAELEESGIEINVTASRHIAHLQEMVTQARALKASYNLHSKRDVTFFYVADETNKRFIEAHTQTLKRLIGAGAFEAREDAPEGMPASVTPLGTLYLDLASSIDIDAEKDRLTKELAKLEKAVVSGEKKLQNENFISKAPPDVVAGAKEQLEKTKGKKDELQRLLETLLGQ